MPAFMRAFLFKSSTKVELSYKARKNLATAGFSACGGSLQRHNSPPPQCDPTRRAFAFTGKFNEVSCKGKNRQPRLTHFFYMSLAELPV